MTHDLPDPDLLLLDPDDVRQRMLRSRTEGGEANNRPPEGVCWLGGKGYRPGATALKDGAPVVCHAGRWETAPPEGGGSFPFPPTDPFDNEAQP